MSASNDLANLAEADVRSQLSSDHSASGSSDLPAASIDDVTELNADRFLEAQIRELRKLPKNLRFYAEPHAMSNLYLVTKMQALSLDVRAKAAYMLATEMWDSETIRGWDNDLSKHDLALLSLDLAFQNRNREDGVLLAEKTELVLNTAPAGVSHFEFSGVKISTDDLRASLPQMRENRFIHELEQAVRDDNNMNFNLKPTWEHGANESVVNNSLIDYAPRMLAKMAEIAGGNRSDIHSTYKQIMDWLPKANLSDDPATCEALREGVKAAFARYSDGTKSNWMLLKSKLGELGPVAWAYCCNHPKIELREPLKVILALRLSELGTDDPCEVGQKIRILTIGIGVDDSMNFFGHIQALRQEMETVAARVNQELSDAADEEAFQHQIRRKPFYLNPLIQQYREKFAKEVNFWFSTISGFPSEDLQGLIKEYAMGIETYIVGDVVKKIPVKAPALSDAMEKALQNLDIDAIRALLKTKEHSIYARINTRRGPIEKPFFGPIYVALSSKFYSDPKRAGERIESAERIAFVKALVNEYKLDPHDNAENLSSTALMSCLNSEDLIAFDALFKEYNLDINQTLSGSQSVLHVAASVLKNVSIYRSMIDDYKADINLVVKKFGRKPVDSMIAYRKFSTVKSDLENFLRDYPNVVLDAPVDKYKNSLDLALGLKKLDLAEVIVVQRPDILDSKTWSGFTPLEHFFRVKDEKTLKFFLGVRDNFSVSPSVSDKIFELVFPLALQYKSESILKMIKEMRPSFFSQKMNDPKNPMLVKAFESNDLDLFKTLISLGAPISQKNSSEDTLAEMALRSNKLEFLRELLSVSPDLLGWKNPENGNSLLHLAIFQKNSQAIQLIIPMLKPNQYTLNKDGYNPLQLALRMSLNSELIGLIAKKFNNLVDVKDPESDLVPLAYAMTHYKQANVVKALLDAGASPRSVSTDKNVTFGGKSPEKFAIYIGKSDVATLIHEYEKKDKPRSGFFKRVLVKSF